MANRKQVALLRQGSDVWNQWRKENPVKPDLRDADLSDADLSDANLKWANFSWANLSRANLSLANLGRANFISTTLTEADLSATNLRDADLTRANLKRATLIRADLSKANLIEANLSQANLNEANLIEANLSQASLQQANFSGANLGGAGLVGADLFRADFSFADLNQANLNEANLNGANLHGADLCRTGLVGAALRGADLSGACLFKATLSQAFLRGANLRYAELYDVDLVGADLSDADLTDAILIGANLSEATLNRANLSEADLSEANLSRANLNSARLQLVTLDRATLTSAMLWESQRGGWSIKGIVCEQAYWDRENSKAIQYAPGEFEKLHSDQTCIELFYQGGITKFELNTLPALLHRLAALHPGCSIRLKSIEETGGGAKVSIIVKDAAPDVLEGIKTEAQRAQAAQIALRDDRIARLEIERQLLLEEVIPRILAAASQHVHFAGPVVIASGNASVNAQQTTNDLSAILPLLNEFMRGRAELGLPQDQEMQLAEAVRSVEQELHKSDPQPSVVASGLKVVKEIATKVIVNVAEKALTDHWHPLLEQLTHFLNLLAR